MSWEENIVNRIQITTGDGQVWEPLTMIQNNTASFEFNISEFEFPEVAGTKVDKRLRKGVRYPLELYFQGPDCIVEGKAFVEASNDQRPWEVIHPVFGQFTGHPISIEMDASGINIFKISCTVVETILEDGAKTVFDPAENVKFILNKSKETNVSTFESSISSFETTDVVLMQNNVTAIYNASTSSITDQDTFNKYLNFYNTAQTKINTALNDYLFGITYVQDFINYPATFVLGIKSRLVMIKNQCLALSNSLDQFNIEFYNEKKIFENNKGELINTLIQTISTPQENDYQNAVDIFYVIEQALDMYNTFIDELQSLQSGNGYEVGAYLPNAEFLESLSYSFNYAIANLFTIALTAQQERIVHLEEDSNIILLTHRFYGLEQDDSTLKRFIETNNIGLSETLQIKKGRKLVYYV